MEENKLQKVIIVQLAIIIVFLCVFMVTSILEQKRMDRIESTLLRANQYAIETSVNTQFTVKALDGRSTAR